MKPAREITAYFADNPLEAEEFVWLTTDIDRAEAVLAQRPTPFKVDMIVYLVQPTAELQTLFAKLQNDEFKHLRLGALKQFSARNAGVPRVSLIAAMRSGSVGRERSEPAAGVSVVDPPR